MRKTKQKIIVAGLLVVVAVVGSISGWRCWLAAGGRLSRVPDGEYLVNGIVARVKMGPYRTAELTIRIDDVYVGPRELMGATFREQASDSGAGASQSCVSPVPRRGKDGIWAIRLSAGNIRVIHDYAGYWWPSVSDARHEQAKQLALAMKAVEAKENRADKGNALAEFAFSAVPEVSRWATRTLLEGDYGKDDLLFDEHGPRSNLPRVGKLVVDDILSKRRGAVWLSSSDRLKVLMELAGGRMDVREARDLHTVLVRILGSKDDEVPSASRISIVRRFVTNRDAPLDERKEIVCFLGYPPKNAHDKNVIALLLDLLEGDQAELSYAAASALLSCGTFSDEQKRRLVEVRDRTKVPQFARIIDQIIAGRTNSPASKLKPGTGDASAPLSPEAMHP